MRGQLGHARQGNQDLREDCALQSHGKTHKGLQGPQHLTTLSCSLLVHRPDEATARLKDINMTTAVISQGTWVLALRKSPSGSDLGQVNYEERSLNNPCEVRGQES